MQFTFRSVALCLTLPIKFLPIRMTDTAISSCEYSNFYGKGQAFVVFRTTDQVCMAVSLHCRQMDNHLKKSYHVHIMFGGRLTCKRELQCFLLHSPRYTSDQNSYTALR